MARRYTDIGGHKRDAAEQTVVHRMGEPRPAGAQQFHEMGSNGNSFRPIGQEAAMRLNPRRTGAAQMQSFAGGGSRGSMATQGAALDPYAGGLQELDSMFESGQITEQEHNRLRYGVLQKKVMSGLNQSMYEFDETTGRARRRSGRERAGSFDDDFLRRGLGLEGAGLEEPGFRESNMFRSRDIYPDANMQEMWPHLSPATQQEYRGSVREFSKNFYNSLVRRNEQFESLDELDEFTKGVEGWNPQIGSAAREIALRQLKKMDADLFKEFQGTQRTENANRISFREWSKRQGAKPDGTEWNFDDAEDRKTFEGDRAATKYKMDPISFDPVEIDPGEPSMEEQAAESRRVAEEQLALVPSGEYEVVPDEASPGMWTVQRRQPTLEELQAGAAAQNAQGGPQYGVRRDLVTGEPEEYQIKPGPEPEPMGGGNVAFQGMTEGKRSERVLQIADYLTGLDPEKETRKSASHKKATAERGARMARKLGLDIVQVEGTYYLQVGEDPTQPDSWYELDDYLGPKEQVKILGGEQ